MEGSQKSICRGKDNILCNNKYIYCEFTRMCVLKYFFRSHHSRTKEIVFLLRFCVVR